MKDNTEERLAMEAIKAAKAITYKYDIISGKIEWGGCVEEILGYTLEEFNSFVDITEWKSLVHPEDRDHTIKIISTESLKSYRSYATYRFKKKDGEYVLLSSRCMRDVDSAGNPMRLVGLLQDVTEKSNLEKKVKKNKEFLKQIIEDLIDLFVCVKKDLTIELSNKKWRAITALTDERELLTKLKPYIERVLLLKKPVMVSNFKIEDRYYDISIYIFNGGVAMLGRYIPYSSVNAIEHMTKLSEKIDLLLEGN